MTTTPQKFRRQVAVEALQFQGGAEGAAEIIAWAETHGATGDYRPATEGTKSMAMPAAPERLRIGLALLPGATRATVLYLNAGDWLLWDERVLSVEPGVTFATTWTPNGATAEEEQAARDAIKPIDIDTNTGYPTADDFAAAASEGAEG